MKSEHGAIWLGASVRPARFRRAREWQEGKITIYATEYRLVPVSVEASRSASQPSRCRARGRTGGRQGAMRAAAYRACCAPPDQLPQADDLHAADWRTCRTSYPRRCPGRERPHAPALPQTRTDCTEQTVTELRYILAQLMDRARLDDRRIRLSTRLDRFEGVPIASCVTHHDGRRRNRATTCCENASSTRHVVPACGLDRYLAVGIAEPADGLWGRCFTAFRTTPCR
jgi:hypothetical protein